MKRGLLVLGIATALACAWMLRFLMHIPANIPTQP